MDGCQTRTLDARKARDPDDEKHLCPLQLDVIERACVLWSNPGEVVLTPFMGVGSEVYGAVANGRRGIGIRLKPSKYYLPVQADQEPLLRRNPIAKNGDLFEKPNNFGPTFQTRPFQKVRRTEMSDKNKAIVKQCNASVVAPSVAPSVIARQATGSELTSRKCWSASSPRRSVEGCTNEQLMALCIVSEQYGLNPWTREIYAFPDKQNGIVPVVGVDGWARIINTHPQFDGVEFEQDKRQMHMLNIPQRSVPPGASDGVHGGVQAQHGAVGQPPHAHAAAQRLIQAARLAFGFSGL